MLHRSLSLHVPFAAALVGSLLTLASAQAADLDFPAGYGYGDAPPPQTKIEFGTGWYIRGDIGATAIPQATSSQPSIYSAGGVFYDNAPNLILSRPDHLGYDASIGGGYAFLKWFRADAIFDFHQPLSSSYQGAPFQCQNGFGENPGYTLASGQTVPATAYVTNGTCTGSFKASLKSYDVLANGYFDIGTWYGITPYVGAGIGLSFGHYQTAATYTQADGSSYNISVTNPVTTATYNLYYDRFSSGNYYNFAFALMAGIAYDIFPHTKLDIGYRYLNEGKVFGQTLDYQEVRAGLRYMVDN